MDPHAADQTLDFAVLYPTPRYCACISPPPPLHTHTHTHTHTPPTPYHHREAALQQLMRTRPLKAHHSSPPPDLPLDQQQQLEEAAAAAAAAAANNGAAGGSRPASGVAYPYRPGSPAAAAAATVGSGGGTGRATQKKIVPGQLLSKPTVKDLLQQVRRIGCVSPGVW
jgi:hypothetical protein